jgi:hypothetical protein
MQARSVIHFDRFTMLHSPPPPPTHPFPKGRNPVPRAPPVPQTPSPVQVVKKRVPPSPGSSHHSSSRDQAMACPFLEHQAVEVDDDGVSQSGSCNSQDDSNLSKLSCVTDGTRANNYCKCTIVDIVFCRLIFRWRPCNLP